MVGTIMDMDVEMVPCETIDLTVPAHAEIIVEGEVNLEDLFDEEEIIAPTMYALPKKQKLPELRVTAITMRADRPIYRNHQVVPETDHQVLPRLCHEAVLYNRLTEMGLKVHDVRFPTWGAAVSCIIKIEYPRQGFVNDALMQCMGAPWLNTKMVVAVSPDTDVDDPRTSTSPSPHGPIRRATCSSCPTPAATSATLQASRWQASTRTGSWARSASTRPASPGTTPRTSTAPGRRTGAGSIWPTTWISAPDRRPGSASWTSAQDSALWNNNPDQHARDNPTRCAMTEQTGLESDPIIPYADPADLPAALRSAIESYAQRMGFLPNALKLYMHRPQILKCLIELNNTVMRDASGHLDDGLKRRVAAVCSALNHSPYCVAHNANTLKGSVEGDGEGWGYSDEDVRALLDPEFEPDDPAEAACFAFARRPRGTLRTCPRRSSPA